MVQIEKHIVSEKAGPFLRKSQQNGAIIERRDILKEVSQGSILYLILLIKHLKNGVETKFGIFEDDMKKTADKRVVENRIRIQQEFVKLAMRVFLLKKNTKNGIQQVQQTQHQFPRYRMGKSKQDYSCLEKMQSESQAKHESPLLRCCKKENATQMGWKQENSLQNRQTNYFALLPHDTA